MISTAGMCDRSTLMETRDVEIELGEFGGGHVFKVLVCGGGGQSEREARSRRQF